MATDLTAPRPVRPDVAPIQRRTLRLLFTTQIVGGIGVTIGISVGALLAARIAGTAVAGLAQSAGVVGAALLAVPVTRIMTRHGRRPGLAVAYAVGAIGGLLVVLAAATRSVPLLFLGMLLFGGGTAANLQARYTAVDLAEPARRARQLSMIVWATTIGAVAAPNFAALADRVTTGWGCRRWPARSRSARPRSCWLPAYSSGFSGPTRCSPPAGSRRPTHRPPRRSAARAARRRDAVGLVGGTRTARCPTRHRRGGGRPPGDGGRDGDDPGPAR
ncbi:hypothetical protein GCM10027614_67790 [Micromonospora vulcania]